MNKHKVIIHLGLPKTATTSLQNLVYHKLHTDKKIHYIGKVFPPREDPDKSPSFLIREYVENEKHSKDKVRSLLRKGFINVYSDECMSCCVNKTLEFKLKRLQNVFHEDDVTLILTLRNQIDFFLPLSKELNVSCKYLIDLMKLNQLNVGEYDSDGKRSKPMNLMRFFNFYFQKIASYKKKYPLLKITIESAIVQQAKVIFNRITRKIIVKKTVKHRKLTPEEVMKLEKMLCLSKDFPLRKYCLDKKKLERYGYHID